MVSYATYWPTRTRPPRCSPSAGDQVVSLIADANALLLQLQPEPKQRAGSDFEQHLGCRAADQGLHRREPYTFKPAFDSSTACSAIVDNRKARVQESIKKLNAYAMSLVSRCRRGPLQGLHRQPAARQFVSRSSTQYILRSWARPLCAVAVRAQRPTDGPAGHTGAARAVSAHGQVGSRI